MIAIGSAETTANCRRAPRRWQTRNSEYGERIEQQSATIDVLKAMSASPGDPQPVFDLIVRRAQRAVQRQSVGLFESTASWCSLRASFGGDDRPRASGSRRCSRCGRPRQSLAGRAILDGQIVHVRDMDAEPGMFQAVRDMGAKTTISRAFAARGVRDRRHLAELDGTGRVLRQPDRVAADLRRTGGDRHRQRRDVSRIAGAHRGAGRSATANTASASNSSPPPSTC